MKHKLLLICAFLALTLCPPILLASPNSPIITFGGMICGLDGVCTSQTGSLEVNFDSDNWNKDGYYHLNGANLVIGDQPPYNYAPTGDYSYYLTTGPNNGNVIIDYRSPWTYFGLYWGSVDSGNIIEIRTTDSFFMIPGSEICMLSGITCDAGQSIYVNFFASGDETFKEIELTSATGVSFESDNHAFNNVPEPSSLVLLGIGISGVAAALRRRLSI